MAEINVTPMVDVMLVLLIIFMVSAPLLTVGVPIDLPQSQATSLDQDKEPLTLSVNDKGQVFLQNSEIDVNELVPKLKAGWVIAAFEVVLKFGLMVHLRKYLGDDLVRLHGFRVDGGHAVALRGAGLTLP